MSLRLAFCHLLYFNYYLFAFSFSFHSQVQAENYHRVLKKVELSSKNSGKQLGV